MVEDKSGEACWRKPVTIPEIRERLYRVELDSVMDVSELHKKDPEHFNERPRPSKRSRVQKCDPLAKSSDIPRAASGRRRLHLA